MIRSHTAHDLYLLDSQVPETLISGSTTDISEIAEFEFYQWIYFRDVNASYPEDEEVLSRYLGPAAPDIGPAMCMNILKKNGKLVERSTLRALKTEDHSLTEMGKLATFDIDVKEKLGMALLTQTSNRKMIWRHHSMKHDSPPLAPVLESESVDTEAFDKYVSARVMLPRDSALVGGKISRRKRDRDGNPVGRSNVNLILDTRVYEIEFPDGHVDKYDANVIAEHMYSQVDSEGHRFMIMDEIVDHEKDGSAVAAYDQYITVNGRQHSRKSAKGWNFCIQWMDGSTSWEALKDPKESNPVEIAEYVVSNKLLSEPVFSWWVP
jgi:hypothetical protein